MHIQTGSIVEGKVTGIQPYGAFVQLDETESGLIHISEISNGFISDISSFVKVGDTLRCKVIDYDEKSHHARLSLKALTTTPRRRRINPNLRKPMKMKIGFESVGKALPKWIEEGLQEMEEHDKI